MNPVRALLFAASFAFGFTFHVMAQPGVMPATYRAPDEPDSLAGETRLFVPREIREMVEMHKRINLEEGVLAGYRIQVFASPVIDEVRQARNRFEAEYGGFGSRIVLQEPDFKLFAGRYVDRFDAYRDLQTLIPDYPGAFIVRDLIDVSEL